MKAIRRWINRLNSSQKLIVYGYLILTPVMLCVTLLLLLISYNAAQDRQMDNQLNSVKAVAESVSVTQTEAKDFTTYLSINARLRELLTTGDPEEKNRNARLWEEETPLSLIQDVLSLKGYIKTIAIYPENGIRPYLRGMDGSVYQGSIEDVRQLPIYRETQNDRYHIIWRSAPANEQGIYLVNRDDKIILCREVYDLSGSKPLAFIVLSIGGEDITGLCDGLVQSDQEGVLILGPDSAQLATRGTIDADIMDYLCSDAFAAKASENSMGTFYRGRYSIIYSRPDPKADLVCKVMPRYSAGQQLHDIAYMPLMLLLAVLLGMLPVFLIISHLYTKPLREISNAIRKFSGGDFTQHLEVTTQDELGEVADCFNHMVDAIRRLIDENYGIRLKEKESELQLLQAQINPHFLYNTLDSLYWQAIEKDNEELAESILSLSQLFRLVLSRGKGEIPLEDEFELVSCYLKVQKMRFTDRLQYSIDLSDEVRNIRIPKLIVQPFVENAIVHGFEQTNSGCQVAITAFHEEDYVCIEVLDTGAGMTKEQLDALTDDSRDDPYAKQRMGGYAIRNIRERLQMKYQDRFTLDIQSEPGKGTIVLLKIPFEEG